MPTTKPQRPALVAVESPQIEFLILADKAEVLGNKLYMMGGGWDRVQIPQFPALYPMAIAMRVRLPDHDPRDDHSIEVVVRQGDSPPLAAFGFQLLRQSFLPGGIPQVAVFAFPVMAQFRGPGICTVQASIDGIERAATTFLVEQPPAPPVDTR